jgi:hypothetical protein
MNRDKIYINQRSKQISFSPEGILLALKIQKPFPNVIKNSKDKKNLKELARDIKLIE